MRKSTLFKIALVAILLIPAVAFIHYWTPRETVVRLTGTEAFRGSPSTQASSGARDSYEIYAQSLDGTRTYEFVNQDFWLYFKFDSTSVQSSASAIANAENEENRVAALTIIGWRIPILDMFPNVLNVKRVEPGYSSFPWGVVTFWVIILGIIGTIAFFVRRFINKIKAKREAARLEAEQRRQAEEEARRQREAERQAQIDTAKDQDDEAVKRFIEGDK